MSGAEVVAAIGIVSGIITIVDSIIKVCNSTKAGNLPPSFRGMARKLPLVQETLRAVEKRLTEHHHDKQTFTSIADVLHNCESDISILDSIFKQSIPQQNTSKLNRIRSIARPHGQRDRVAALAKGMLEDVQLLTQRLTVQEAAAKHIQDVSARAKGRSNGEETANSYYTISHYGSGYQNIHSGSEKQNLVLGSVAQYNRNNQVFLQKYEIRSSQKHQVTIILCMREGSISPACDMHHQHKEWRAC